MASGNTPQIGRWRITIWACALFVSCAHPQKQQQTRSLTAVEIQWLGTPSKDNFRRLVLSVGADSVEGEEELATWPHEQLVLEAPALRRLADGEVLTLATYAQRVEFGALGEECESVRKAIGADVVRNILQSTPSLDLTTLDACGLQAIAAEVSLSHVTEIVVGAKDSSSVLAEIGSVSLPRLRGLVLTSAAPTVDAFRALKMSPNFRSVESIEVWGGSAQFLSALAADSDPSLRRLHIYRAGVDDQLLTGLSNSLCRLDSLQLEENQITQLGARSLALHGCLEDLRELDLSENPVGDEGALVLLESHRLAGLRHVNLRSADIEAAASAIFGAQSPLSRNLISLNLAENAIPAESLKTMFANGPSSALQSLDLSGCEVDAAVMQAFVDSGVWPNLRTVAFGPMDERALQVLMNARIPALESASLIVQGVQESRAHELVGSSTWRASSVKIRVLEKTETQYVPSEDLRRGQSR